MTLGFKEGDRVKVKSDRDYPFKDPDFFGKIKKIFSDDEAVLIESESDGKKSWQRKRSLRSS